MALKASVHIETALRAGRTILKRSFCDAPFKLADVTEDKRQKHLNLMLMCSSPGVLDGDEYDFTVFVGEGSSLHLQTQSYQRIFQMKKGALQNTNVQVNEGASFVYLPHPAVPHKHSNFKGRNKIYVSGNCTLIWGEVISCGRKLNNEVFQFSSYHNWTEIYLNGRLSVKENLLLKPRETALNAVGQMEGYTHQSTFIYVNEKAAVDELSADCLRALEREENVTFGVSALPANGLAARVLGHKAEQLFMLNQRLYSIVEETSQRPVLKTKTYV